MKRIIIYNRRVETRTAPPCLASSGDMSIGQLKLCTTLCMSVNDHESTAGIHFGLANKF